MTGPLTPAEDPLGRTYAAVLLDMDGTLLSSVAAVVRSWRTLAIELAIPAERFGDFHGMPARRLLATLLPDADAEALDRAHDRIVELELADLADTEVLPGAADALTVLGAAGLCAVVTSSTRELARARLAVLDLPQVPVVTADDVEHGKPAPDAFLAGAALLGVAAEDCLVVEDATAGVAAGRAAGATVVGLRTTRPDLDADLVVDDLGALRFAVVDGRVAVARAGGPDGLGAP